MTNIEIINKIYLGTKPFANRKELSEANLMFQELKSEITVLKDNLMKLAKSIGVENKGEYDLKIDLEIEYIEKLLNPNYIHKKENPEQLSNNKKLKKVKLKDGFEFYTPTDQEKIVRLVEHHTLLLDTLKNIFSSLDNNLDYPGSMYAISKNERKTKEINMNSDFNEYQVDSDYCGACMSSPCICSDFEQTSTLY